MWINARGLASIETNSVYVMGKCSARGYRGTNVAAKVVAPVTNAPLIEMESYETTMIASSGSTDGSPTPNERRLCATLRWKPDLDSLATKDLPAVILSPKAQLSASAEYYHDLHLVLRYFLSTTLKSIGDADIDQETYSSHAQNLISWMKYQLSGASYGETDLEKRMLRDENFRHEKIEYARNFNAEGRVLTAVGENLYDIIFDKISSVQLLFEGNLASDYYQQLMSEGPNIPSLNKYLDLLGHKNPGMRILEIGSGTGSSTQAVTTALVENGRPRWSFYDYTDVSAGFFPEAQNRFSQFADCMGFKVLDAAGDLLEQGFEENCYDLVVAGNVRLQ
jgi:SAM-dependent methyltransferase